MKDTCKQAIFRKNTRSRSRAEYPLRAGDQEERELEFFNTYLMKRHLNSRNPALNVPRRHKGVATDTVYSDTPAVDSGFKQVHLFACKESLVSEIYSIRSGKHFLNTFEANICRRGAMVKIISDSTKNEIFHKAKDILKVYKIKDWQSEPYHQIQSPAEWKYRTIKAWANTIMNRPGASAHYWLLTLQYVCYILNHMSTASLVAKSLFRFYMV